jgi:hypothetical protein
MTCVDADIKYLAAVPLRNKSAVSVAKAFVRYVSSTFGMSRRITTDFEKVFHDGIMQQVCKLLYITHLRTTRYRTSSNERTWIIHYALNSVLDKVVADNQTD